MRSLRSCRQRTVPVAAREQNIKESIIGMKGDLIMKQRTLLRCLAFILCLMAAMACLAPAALALEAKTTKSTTLREGAGTDSSTISKLKSGVTVTVLDAKTNPKWWKVSHEGKEGYIDSETVKLVEQPAEPATTTRNIAMRAEPKSNAAVLDELKIYSQVAVLDSKSHQGWWKVFYENQEGYIPASALKMGDLASLEQRGTTGGTETTLKAPDPNASKITKAKGINKDTVGWIKVPNTNIDDPILYGANFYYNDHNLSKKKSLEGVYPYRNSLSKNVVIFGHNLRGSNSGMHQLHHLQEVAMGKGKCQYGSCGRGLSHSDWYKTSSGRTWSISIFGKTQWEVWAMYEVPRNEPIETLRNNWNTGPASMSKWIDGQLKRSQINFGVSVSDKDQIMTLITCGTYYDSATANSRLFTFLKCVG